MCILISYTFQQIFETSESWIVYSELGETMQDDELRAMIQEFDGDDDGESE